MTRSRICSRIGVKRMLPRYKRDWRDICAVLPTYLSDGTNGTTVTYLDSTDEAVAYRTCWVVDDLLMHLRTSSSVLANHSKAVLGKTARRVPLVAPHGLSLVPVKGRHEYAKGDGTVGYIVMEHVEDVIPHGDTNTVYFTGGTHIDVLDTTRTLWANLNLTKDLKAKFEEELQWQSTPLHSVGA